MNKIRNFLVLILATALVSFYGMVRVDAITLNNNHCVHECQPTPTPTLTPTPTPKGEDCDHEYGDFKEGKWECPTPTPTSTPTPTPPINPCDLIKGAPISDAVKAIVLPCITPTPTASPTPPVTTNVSDNRASDPGATEAHPAVCTQQFDHPLLQGFKVNSSTSVTFSWWGVSNIDKYSIRYGYTPDKLVYGADNIPSSSTAFTIENLQPGNHVWAIVTAWRGACAEDSGILDPVLPRK